MALLLIQNIENTCGCAYTHTHTHTDTRTHTHTHTRVQPHTHTHLHTRTRTETQKLHQAYIVIERLDKSWKKTLCLHRAQTSHTEIHTGERTVPEIRGQTDRTEGISVGPHLSSTRPGAKKRPQRAAGSGSTEGAAVSVNTALPLL